MEDFNAIPLLDQDQFDLLVESGDDAPAELLNELLEMFRNESAPRLEEVSAVTAAGERERAAKAAHAIAGSSSNISGQRLAAICRHYESIAPKAAPEELSTIANLIQETFTVTIGAIQAEIDKLSA